MPEPPTNVIDVVDLVDVVDEILGIEPVSPLAELRAQRPEARAHAEGSYREIFDPEDPGGVPLLERFAIALRVAAIHRQPELVAHYGGRLRAAADQTPLAAAPIPAAELIAEGTVSDPRLAAVLRHTGSCSTQPAQAAATPDDLEWLRAALDWGPTRVDVISQTDRVCQFQARLVAGLPCRPPGAEDRDWRHRRWPPRRPVSPRIGWDWIPWVEPLERADADPDSWQAIDAPHGDSPYFRLLARAVRILRERSTTDRGIFYTHGGLPRAERELAATAASKVNGCIFCASVHSHFAVALSKRPEAVQRLLDDGPAAALDPRWQAIVEFAGASPRRRRGPHPNTWASCGRRVSTSLRFSTSSIGGFFAWANRLMLTLGEPSASDVGWG